MRQYFFLPYMGIKDQRMKKLLFMIITVAACGGAAFAQSQRQISNILREQQQWKNRQLPANSVQRNFGGTNYAAAAWMEGNKPNRKAMSAITLPRPALQTPFKNLGEGSVVNSFSLPAESLHLQTAFMRWLISYLPVRAIE
jgi:hypothetical protein